MATALEKQIAARLTPTIESMGYRVVRMVIREGKRKTLQIMAEHNGGNNLSVDDCVKITHAVSAILDVEDPIQGSYGLEVSSPGIDRPLVELADFNRYLNHEAKFVLKTPLEGARKFNAILSAVEENIIITARKADKKSLHIPIDQIESAQLILTDKLIAASKPNMAEAE